VIVDVLPGFLTLRLDEEPFRLGDAELRPTLSRPLPILQTCGPLTGSPKVDDFRHVNERR
jgi:hypothetical protein